MNKTGIIPDHPTDSWIKKWFLGLVIAIPSFIYGSYCIVTQHSYAVQSRGHTVPIDGFQAVFMGLFYIGLGLFLFSNYFAVSSSSFSPFIYLGTCTGLVLVLIGITVAEWTFIFI